MTEARVIRSVLASWIVLCLVAVPLAGQTAPRLELQSATLGLRYRMLENQLGARTQNWSDHHQGFRLRLRLDNADRYAVTAVAFNGDTFQGSWNVRGWRDGQSSNRVFVKQLYVSGKPFDGVELQYGGLGVVRGESTEITSYDNDGYLMGQRLTLSPNRIVDELTMTAGYLGDFRKPSVTRRLHRLSEINYGQILVRKQLSDRLTATADYTEDDGERTLRQAMVIRPARIVDLIRFEAYQRVSGERAAGGAVTVEQPFGRTRLAASFASIDDHYRPVNGDRYGRGRRFSLTSTTALTDDVSVQVFVTRALNNQTRVDVLVRYELANLLNSARKP